MYKILNLIAKINDQNAKAPEWMLLFAAGWNSLADGTRFLVDEQAYRLVAALRQKRGNEIVFDYEHASLESQAAPASGWIKELSWQDGRGIMARVEWTDKAKQYISNKEYRYFSPVFYVRRKDSRVCGLDSVALTNRPKTNNLTPILAKLEKQELERQRLEKEKHAGTGSKRQRSRQKEKNMDKKELIAALGLGENASDDEILQKVAKAGIKMPGAGEKEKVVEVIPEKITAALDLKKDDDASTVIASIHALKQTAASGESGVSKADFETLKARLAEKEALDAVGDAMAAGKIAPAQKDWALEYAKNDLKGFNIFVAKAPVVVPVKDLPGKKEDKVDTDLTGAVLSIAGQLGATKEDIEKYGEVKNG